MITFAVVGTPGPQGSKRHVGNGVMVESSAKVKPWREAVAHAAADAKPDGFTGLVGPVSVHVTFYLPRPKSAKFGSLPYRRPDLDKLLRSTFDAIGEAGVWSDDAQVVELTAAKVYVDGGESCGADISVREF